MEFPAVIKGLISKYKTIWITYSENYDDRLDDEYHERHRKFVEGNDGTTLEKFINDFCTENDEKECLELIAMLDTMYHCNYIKYIKDRIARDKERNEQERDMPGGFW